MIVRNISPCQGSRLHAVRPAKCKETGRLRPCRFLRCADLVARHLLNDRLTGFTLWAGGPTSASPRLNPWEVDAIRRKAYTKKYCLAPDAGDAACSGGIVNAHSVQGTLLRRIARDGHVYGDVSSIGTLQRNLGQFTYGLVGVNLASTFTGFCNLHDTGMKTSRAVAIVERYVKSRPEPQDLRVLHPCYNLGSPEG